MFELIEVTVVLQRAVAGAGVIGFISASQLFRLRKDASTRKGSILSRRTGRGGKTKTHLKGIPGADGNRHTRNQQAGVLSFRASETRAAGKESRDPNAYFCPRFRAPVGMTALAIALGKRTCDCPGRSSSDFGHASLSARLFSNLESFVGSTRLS